MDILRNIFSPDQPKVHKAQSGKRRGVKAGKRKRAGAGPRRELTAAKAVREAQLRG